MEDINIQKIKSLCSNLIDAALAESSDLHHTYIGVEHIFIALTRIISGETERVLSSIRLDTSKAREDIKKTIGISRLTPNNSKPCTPRLEKVLQLAEKRAGLNCPILESHMLGAILEEGESIVARYLSSLGLNCAIWANQLLAKPVDLAPVFQGVGADVDGTVFCADVNVNEPSVNARNQSPVLAGPQIIPAKSRPYSAATPTLNNYGRDLSKMARMGNLVDAISREAELEQIITILARTQNSNPILLGESGVGKTAIVEGLAFRIAQGTVPAVIKGKRIVQIDIEALITDTEYNGMFERKIKQLIREVSQTFEIILFIDDTFTSSEQYSYSLPDVLYLLKPALTRNDLSCIIATTQKEYYHHIRCDQSLERRFSPVIVKELTPELSYKILETATERIIEKQAKAGFNLTLAPDVIMTSLKLTDQYIRDRKQPDKSIDVIDLACAKAIVKQCNTITADDIAKVVSDWTGVPISRMTNDEKQRYLKMEEYLCERIIGQKNAISTISKSIRSALAGMKISHKPVGIFLFLGTAGVGKSKLAKELAKFLFQSEQSLIRFDMNDYKDFSSVYNLIGAPRGDFYDTKVEGLLNEALRLRPYSVVLLDEIDKANKDILTLLISILEEGRIIDIRGRQVDCSNAVFIMTSNRKLIDTNYDYYDEYDSEDIFSKKNETLREKVSKFLPHKLINQFTDIIEFEPLKKRDFNELLDVLLKEKIKEFTTTQQMNFNLKVSASAKGIILKQDYDSNMGARYLERAIEQFLLQPFADMIYKNDFDSFNFEAIAEDNQIIFVPINEDDKYDVDNSEKYAENQDDENIEEYKDGFIDEDMEDNE